MKIKTGDGWKGKSKADMINRVLGTDFKQHMQSGVRINRGTSDEILAWFVVLDEKPRGTDGSWLWVDKLSCDGREIEEFYVGDDYLKYKYKMKKGEFPRRLVFQIDPDDVGDRYFCRFMGEFHLVERNDNIGYKRYKKVSDEFKLIREEGR